MKLNLIYACSMDGYIGKGGKLPWHIPEDLDRFKWLTTGCPVIMGRKTWDSLPAKVRPLPGRRNIVMSRSGDSGRIACNGGFYYAASTVEDSLRYAEDFCKTNGCDDAWVIGGKEIYELFESRTDFAHLTLVNKIVEGDVQAPALTGSWMVMRAQDKTSSTGVVYTDIVLKRDR